MPSTLPTADRTRPGFRHGQAQSRRTAAAVADAVPGEVARHLVAVLGRLDRGALERDGRKLLGIEEVRTAEVVVAFLVAGVDGFRLNVQAERALGRIFRIDRERAGKVVEPAAD